MFALLALFAGIILTTCAYGAWENMVRGYWVYGVVATGFFITYGFQIQS